LGEAENGLVALQKCVETQPDLVLLDIGLPELNGMQVARIIQKLVPSCRIIFLTQENSSEIVEEAFKLGAAGYVVKSRAVNDLIPAMVAARNGRCFIGSGVEHSAIVGLPINNCKTSTQDKTPPGSYTPAPYHYVGFCDHDAAVVSAFAGFIERALNGGKAVLSLLRNTHSDDVLRALHSRGVATKQAISEERLTLVKVESLILELMKEQTADLDHLSHVAAGMLESLRIANPGAPVCACGELAPTLLSRGERELALQVERVFDDVVKHYEIELFCGYVLNGLAENLPTFEGICSEHSWTYMH